MVMSRPSVRSLALIPLLASLAGAAELQPGLIGEYFTLKDAGDFPTIAADHKPTLVRVDKQVNFENGEGEFHKTRLSSNFYVRWSGVVKIAQAGKYIFATESDDGSRLLVGGKLVVDNGGPHGMERKTGEIELTAGEHPILVEYFQGSGGAGCKVSWKAPNGDEQPIPGSALSHDKKALAAISWDEGAWKKMRSSGGGAVNTNAWFYKMDTGPVHSATITGLWPEGNIANKGIAVNIGAKHGAEGLKAGVCFDTDLLRYTAGWTGGWLELRGVAYEGNHGPSGPKVTGTQIFGTKAAPGWSKGENLADPRSEPFGPLPADWAKWKGLYISGDQVVLSYTVGGAAVLELPGLEAEGKAISRTFNLAKFTAASTMVVSDLPDGKGAVEGGVAVLKAGDEMLSATLVGAPAGVTLVVDGGRILMKVPAGAAGVFKLVLAGGADAAAAFKGVAKATDPATLTKGGAAHWDKTVEVKGQVGQGEGAYTVDTITLPDDNAYASKLRLGGVDFFSDGRAAVSTWNGDVWVCSGIDDKLEKLTWKRYAAGLYQTLGLRIVDDKIYTLGRDQITRLNDLNGDGEADFFENFNNDMHVTPGFHEFALDLHTDGQGNFIFAKGGPVRPGGNGWETISKHAGTVMRVSKDGSKLEIIGTGVRAPNGSGYGGPDNLVTVGDNQGTWTPACRVTAIPPAKIPMFVGVPDLAHTTPPPTDYTRPIYWSPMNVDNSNGGQVWSPKSDKWGPLSERLMHISYGQSNLHLVLMEKIPDGPTSCGWQGGIVKFPLGFNTGIARGRFNPKDGQLYVAGLKGWQTNGSRDGGLQRVRFTGAPLHSAVGLAVKKNGIAITFATKLDKAEAANKDNYAIEQWNYKWTSNYGSPEFKPSNGEKGHDKVEVAKATLSADGKTVFLEMPTQVVMQMKIKYRLASEDGSAISQEIFNTINHVPDQAGP
jgi:hypothetical protein